VEVVLQKVRILREASCHTSQQVIPGGTRESRPAAVSFMFIRYARTSLDPRCISCWSTVQSFDMEGRGMVKELECLVRLSHLQNLFHVHFGKKTVEWNSDTFSDCCTICRPHPRSTDLALVLQIRF